MVAVLPVAQCFPDRLAELFADATWPPFISADPIASACLPRIRTVFAGHELALVEDGRVLAAGWGVPVGWDGTTAGLPTGYSDTLSRALADHDADRRVDTFVLCAVQVHTDASGRGLAAVIAAALIEHAVVTGLPRVVAPLRPTLKHRYPLVPIEDYLGWRRADGAPFDPWLRTHRRLGAEVLGPAPRSQVFTGTVQQWEEWSGLALPGSGSYVVPDALAPVVVDHRADRGVCVEPGIWVRHR